MKQSNEYAQTLGRLYAQIPKAVFAAIAVSFCSAGGDNLTDSTARLLEEWRILFDNGIVPQKPPLQSQSTEH